MTRINVGRADQVLRVVLGLVLLGFALLCPWAASLGPWVTWPSGLIGAVLLVTGLTRRCPGYALIGTRTD
ncbi:MAG: YgaP family membrane protein [Roseicyclus sp.]